MSGRSVIEGSAVRFPCQLLSLGRTLPLLPPAWLHSCVVGGGHPTATPPQPAHQWLTIMETSSGPFTPHPPITEAAVVERYGRWFHADHRPPHPDLLLVLRGAEQNPVGSGGSDLIL